MNAVILGPHPGSGSFSISNYFNFYNSELPTCLEGWSVIGDCPGGISAASNENRSYGMAKTRLENFVHWPLHLSRIEGDVIHVVDQGLAWYAAFLKGGRRLITVHDLIAYMTWKGVFNCGFIPPRKQLLLWQCVRQLKRADHLISVSNCTAGHLVSFLGIRAARISVIPNVLEKTFSPLSSLEKEAARSQLFENSEYVIIHVGKPSAYKNRIGALRAFDCLHRHLPSARMYLVHGSPNKEERGFLAECKSKGAIRFLPPVARTELRRFYGAADVLIFPSLYEGFGWPPLEAMACGCPVVCTTRGSLKEVVGDAALTTENPYDYDALAEAARSILRETTAASDLRRRGIKRAKQFAPSTILPQMAEVYRMVGQAA